MQRKHGREDFYISGECVYSRNARGESVKRAPNAIEEVRKFRFSRVLEQGKPLSEALVQKIAAAMGRAGAGTADSRIPAGFTYLGQFVDHDLTLDKTAVKLGSQVTVEELLQGRSPSLDLDSLYGLGPQEEPDFYNDGLRLRLGSTSGTNFPNDPLVAMNLADLDLPRVGVGQTKDARRKANIPDRRNDENLAVAQVHLAFIRFHNKIVDELTSAGVTGNIFEQARDQVVKHYQAMLRDDYLPRICDEKIVRDVFTNGRRFFEVSKTKSRGTPTLYVPIDSGNEFGSMPVEFSVAAFRLGHSMVRTAYLWNRVFQSGGPGPIADLNLLFQFSGTSGTLSPDGNVAEPNSGSFERLPTNWVPNWRRLFDFSLVPGQSPDPKFNFAQRIDTVLTPLLLKLPPGSFNGVDSGPVPAELQANLAFRNLTRANMVALASGQQAAAAFGLTPLTDNEILNGNDGAAFTDLGAEEAKELTARTPLWFYILREAEVQNDGEKLGPVGSTIVVETFHRAMQTSRYSIVRDPSWRPTRGSRFGSDKFLMVHLLLDAFGEAGLNPLGE